jgi:hypothetical protein
MGSVRSVCKESKDPRGHMEDLQDTNLDLKDSGKPKGL